MAFFAFVFVSPVLADTTNGSDDTASAAASTNAGTTGDVTNGGDDSNANPAGGNGNVGTSGTVTNGDDDGVTNQPNNGGGGSPGTVTNGDDDTTVNPGDTNGPGGNGGTPGNGGSPSGSNRSSGNGSSGSIVYTPTVLGAATTSCPLITDYLKFGGTNNPVQVTNLQIFLRANQKADVTVNGIFDQKTEDAVKAFQKKYLSDILGPWDATRPTGFVYITTTKKINALACASPVVLSAEERAIIEAYKARTSDQATGVEVGSNGSTNLGTVGADVLDDNDNVAAAGEASVLSRFWDFIKSLFR